MEQRFRYPKSNLKEEVKKGRFPSAVCCKVLYTSPEERRQTPAFLGVSVMGADVNLTFTCTIMQEEAGMHVWLYQLYWQTKI